MRRNQYQRDYCTGGQDSQHCKQRESPGLFESGGSLRASLATLGPVLASPAVAERLAMLVFRAFVRSAHEDAEQAAPFVPTG